MAERKDPVGLFHAKIAAMAFALLAIIFALNFLESIVLNLIALGLRVFHITTVLPPVKPSFYQLEIF